MNVFINSIGVPRTARNRRVYTHYVGRTYYEGGGNGGTTIQQSESVDKLTLPFSPTTTPQITDYEAAYSSRYGQYPTVVLYVFDGSGNRIERSDKPYFVLSGGRIDSINFGTLEATYSGFILLSK